MKKRTQRKPKPRYLTIRIQYYPINKKIVLAAIVVFFTFLFTIIFNSSLREVLLWSKDDEAISTNIKMPQEIATLLPSLAMTSNITTSGEIILHGARDKKQIALTFDADMTEGMESQLASGEVASYYNTAVTTILNQTETKATLFLTGMWIEVYPDATKEFANNPLFELGSHSYSHPSFDGTCYGLRQISDAEDDSELQKTQALLKEFAGITNSYFRFPGGCYSQTDVEKVYQNGLQVIHWDVAGEDGFNQDPRAIENNVINNVRNGSIIVLHMHGGPNAPKTAEALPTIITTLKERGFIFVKVSELLGRQKTVQAFDITQLLRND